MCQPILNLLFASVDLVVGTDINWDYCVFLDDELKTDSVALVNRYAVEPFLFAREFMQAE